MLSHGLHGSRIAHNLKGLGYRTHTRVPNHEGDWLIVTGHRDNLAFFSGLDHCGKGILALRNTNGGSRD
jgi:hypothetical protein